MSNSKRANDPSKLPKVNVYQRTASEWPTRRTKSKRRKPRRRGTA